MGREIRGQVGNRETGHYACRDSRLDPLSTNSDITTESTFHFSPEYKEFFSEIKNQIRTARFQTVLSVNCEVIKLYWYIGNQILYRQQTTTWGSKLIETLSKDLRFAFPETSGFSPPNLKRMRMTNVA